MRNPSVVRPSSIAVQCHLHGYFDLLPPRAHLMVLRRIERRSFLPNLGQRVGIGPTYFLKRELQAGHALLSLLLYTSARTWLCNSLCSKRRCQSLPSCHDWHNVPPYPHGIQHLLLLLTLQYHCGQNGKSSAPSAALGGAAATCG